MRNAVKFSIKLRWWFCCFSNRDIVILYWKIYDFRSSALSSAFELVIKWHFPGLHIRWLFKNSLEICLVPFWSFSKKVLKSDKQSYDELSSALLAMLRWGGLNKKNCKCKFQKGVVQRLCLQTSCREYQQKSCGY